MVMINVIGQLMAIYIIVVYTQYMFKYLRHKTLTCLHAVTIFISIVELYKWHSQDIIYYYSLHKLYCLMFVLKKGQILDN